jgi:hypothetical protein
MLFPAALDLVADIPRAGMLLLLEVKHVSCQDGPESASAP